MATSAEVSAFKSQIAADVNRRAITVGTFNINQYINRKAAPIQTAMHEAMRTGTGIFGIQEFCEGFPEIPDSASKIPGVYDFVGKSRVMKVMSGTTTGYQCNAFSSLFGFQTPVTGGVFSDLNLIPGITGEQPRGWAKAVVNTAYKNVSVYSVHFSQNGNTLVKKHAEEFAKIFKADTNYYKVIVGDFNSFNQYGELNSLVLPLDQGGCGVKPVFPFGSGQIDNILAPSYMTVLESGSVPSAVTDHRMYFATLQFN
ncbi:endonuclease/exonuclease/phosphatase family protein [Romboutsia sp.]|uniref:endonuclease/exonuclease/phosphatase family protein n=1 Tax=Romboutsia sp. TaxID=1965302 RepID=UPI003F39B572